MKIDTNLKHELYEKAVQCHESDIDFMNEEFEIKYGKKPLSLREDFGGTAAMACDWVKQSPNHKAWGVDLDEEPVEYGKRVHYSKLNSEQQDRMTYLMGNVLEPKEFKVDVIAAFNFSYFIFKERKVLLEYFKMAREGLKDDGALFLDIFGGEEARSEQVEETEHETFSYYWDLDKYNPITDECLYYIHFKTHKDKKKYKNVFTYDWRMWGIQEIKDVLMDAGFSSVQTYWEGDDDDGGGDGDFYQTNEGENCESWVSYICAFK